ncbi:hypothetical protein BY996DRAFT_3848626 [Phakopsora pachyrhizi]|nr:hypothetical protein BY996DRAFT_3848626 [Phakopsora pachyrhizi]
MSSLDPSESQCVSSRSGSYSPLTRPLKLDLTSHLNSSIELPYNSCDSDQQDETAILSIDPSTQAHPNSQGGVDLMNSEVSQYGWSGAVGDREDDVSRVARNGAADVNRAAVAVSNDGCPTPSRINNDWSEVTPSCRLDNHSEVLTAVSDRSMVFDWTQLKHFLKVVAMRPQPQSRNLHRVGRKIQLDQSRVHL